MFKTVIHFKTTNSGVQLIGMREYFAAQYLRSRRQNCRFQTADSALQKIYCILTVTGQLLHPLMGGNENEIETD